MQGIIPDSSVPIKTGTVPDLGTPDVNANTGQVKPIVFPKPAYAPEDPLNRVYRPEEFGYSASVFGGFINNGMGAALLASDMPAFEVQQGYDAEAALLTQEKELGYQVDDVDREHLLRSRSEGEYMYRQFQIDEKALGNRAMAANPLTGMAGSAADVDVFLGYGVGVASRAAKLGRAATAASLTVGVAAGTTGTYAYAYGDAPFSTTDAATHVAVASSLAFLYGTGFKYGKKGEEATNAQNTPTNGTSADITDLESGLAGVGRSGDTTTVNRAAMDSMDVDNVRYSEMKALRGTRLTENTHSKVKGVIDSAFGKSAFDSVLKSDHIHLLESANQLPKALQDTAGTHIYDPLTDTLFIMGDKITKDNARTVMMQGIGVSVGLERTLGTATYDGLIGALEALAKNGDANASAALAGAKGKDYLRAENALADYIGKSGAEVGLVREVIAKIKTYLNDNFGMDVNLTKDDIVALIQSSTKRTLKKPQLTSPDTTHVWAGSAAQFDEFDTSFIGTGEGNVLQGWGLYGSADKNVADWYRIKETSVRDMPKSAGGLYRAKLKDAKSSDFLAWESTTQSPQVKAVLKKAGIPTTGTGKEIYFNLMSTMPGDTTLAKAKATSEYLYSLGIKGNKYPTSKSKQASSNTNNYVFFSDKNLAIDKKYTNTTEGQPLRNTAGSEANKRIVDDPKNATDEDILNAIDDSNDIEFQGVL